MFGALGLNGIESVLADPVLQAKLVAKGYARVKEFSWNRSAKELAQTLYSL